MVYFLLLVLVFLNGVYSVENMSMEAEIDNGNFVVEFDDNVSDANETNVATDESFVVVDSETNGTKLSTSTEGCGNWSIWNNKSLLKPRMITREELASKNGTDPGKTLWIAMMSEIFDVTTSPHFYAEGAGYHIFVGRDANVPFISGNFTEYEASLSIDTLDINDKWMLQNFLNDTYKSGEKWKYPFVGLLIGDLYKSNGEPTDLLCKIRKEIAAEDVVKKAEEKFYAELAEERERELKEQEELERKMNRDRSTTIKKRLKSMMRWLKKMAKQLRKQISTIVKLTKLEGIRDTISRKATTKELL